MDYDGPHLCFIRKGDASVTKYITDRSNYQTIYIY